MSTQKNKAENNISKSTLKYSPTNKLKKLTPEQEALIPIVRDEWVNHFFDTKEIDEEEFEKGIAWLYNDLLNKPTPKFVYCDSWKAALAMIVRFKSVPDIKEFERVKEECYNLTLEEIDSTEGMDKYFYEYSNYLSNHSNYGWVSFYNYFSRIGVLENKDFEKYTKLIRSGCFQTYAYDNIVFAVKPPSNMVRNETGELNNAFGPALEFRNGHKYYIINGFNISQEIFEAVCDRTYTPEQFFKEDNEEVKSAIISLMGQRHGDNEVAQFFKKNLKEVDSFVDKKSSEYLKGTSGGMNVGVYTLFKGIINKENISYVRCYCPSTDRMFYLGVEPTYTTAKDAIASLYRVPRKLKKYLIGLSRQGERFVSKFSEEGTKMIKSGELTKEDYQDTTTISGGEYFDLMTYEY